MRTGVRYRSHVWSGGGVGEEGRVDSEEGWTGVKHLKPPHKHQTNITYLACRRTWIH